MEYNLNNSMRLEQDVQNLQRAYVKREYNIIGLITAAEVACELKMPNYGVIYTILARRAADKNKQLLVVIEGRIGENPNVEKRKPQLSD